MENPYKIGDVYTSRIPLSNSLSCNGAKIDQNRYPELFEICDGLLPNLNYLSDLPKGYNYYVVAQIK